MPSNEFTAVGEQTCGEYNGPHRNGEVGAIPPRSRRFHFNGHHWFFRTRERISLGPCTTFHEAEQVLELYLRRCGVASRNLGSHPPVSVIL